MQSSICCGLPQRRPQKRCWNCRGELPTATSNIIADPLPVDLKVACDRTLPSCQNCRTRKQACLGYGLKLSWPRESDRRRFSRAGAHYLAPVQAGRPGFINTTVEDMSDSLKLYRNPMSDDILWLYQLPQHMVGSIEPLLTEKSRIIGPYTTVLCLLALS